MSTTLTAPKNFGSYYEIEQDSGTLTICFSAPGKGANEIDVQITATTLKAGIKGQKPIVEGTLFSRVHKDDSTWFIDGYILNISLQKSKPQKWPILFQGPRLDNDTESIDGQSQFYLGEHLEKDNKPKEALDHFKESARKGSLKAQNKMASICAGEDTRYHLLIDLDIKEAVAYLKMASDQWDDPHAQLKLGQFYRDGKENFPADIDQAIEWYRKATSKGDPVAMFQLANILLDQNNTEEGLKLLEQSSDKEHPQASYQLGMMFWNGEHFSKDPVKAQNFFQKAKRAGMNITAPTQEEINQAIVAFTTVAQVKEQEQLERRRRHPKKSNTKIFLIPLVVVAASVITCLYIFSTKRMRKI